MLAARDLSKAYAPDTWALDGLHLTVADGELVMLLGANGAGKTTTIRCFLDFVRPTRGTALVDDVHVADRPVAAKRRLAFVPEHVVPYAALTGRQNVAYFAGLDGSRVTRAAAGAALERVGLPAAAADRPVRGYSKGMRQKVGLAVAIARGTPNLLLDEPTTGLDPQSAHDLMAALGELRDGGCAILMSTHDLFRARTHADRVGFMRAGRLVALRTRAELAGTDVEREYLDHVAPANAAGRGAP